MSEMTWTEARAMARDAAERAQRRREEAAEIERRPVGDWQPYDPEADR